MLNFGFDRIRFFGEIFGPPRFCVNCVNRPPGYAAVRHQASELQNTEWHQVPLGNKPAGLKRRKLQHELFSQLPSSNGIGTHDCLSTNLISLSTWSSLVALLRLPSAAACHVPEEPEPLQSQPTSANSANLSGLPCQFLYIVKIASLSILFRSFLQIRGTPATRTDGTIH